MSHYTPMHARDGQRRDALRARARDTWTRIRKLATLEFHLEFWLSPWGPDWWDWEWVQAHWYRQFKRADRKAFAAECEEIRARALMTPAPELRPAQETPRPVDPPREMARGAEVRAGATPRSPGAVCADDGTGASAGDPPAPAAGATPPHDGGAATLPRPDPSLSPGPGQPQRAAWVTYPGEHPMPSYKGDYARTQPFRAIGAVPVSVVRPYYPAVEARRDSVARWGA